MTAVLEPPQIRYTPQDLLTMQDGDHYELVDGELVEKDMGALSSRVAGNVLRAIGNFAETQQLGETFDSECGYQCFLDAPGKVRRPDVSFIRAERLSPDQIPDGHIPIAPDLAVEVVSPNDQFYEVEAKIGEYLRAEVRLIWLVNPKERSVHVYRRGGGADRLTEEHELTGEDVLPGFRCRVSDLLPPNSPSERAEPAA
jgi:Uma2 family endonuclease